MHPAPSIIVFTTLSGLGYGLAFALGLDLIDAGSLAASLGHLLALALIAGGLLSSTLHLGNPQRAWRAFSQWRTSWLSREGVLAVATFVPLTAAAAAALFAGLYLPAAGLAGALLAAVTVYCTSMIYASLRAIDAWHTPLTPAAYLAFALAGGLLLTTLLASFGAGATHLLAFAAVAATVLAWGIKAMWWQRLDSTPPTSTAATATGLGAIGAVRLFERPHMNGNYLTREMGFKVARKHAAKLRVIALVAGGSVPVVALLPVAFGVTGWMASLLALLGVAGFVLGVLAERWLFFAEARHAVSSYYGG